MEKTTGVVSEGTGEVFQSIVRILDPPALFPSANSHVSRRAELTSALSRDGCR